MKKIDANPQGFLSELGKLLAEEKEKKAKENLDEKTKLEQKFGIETVAPTTLGEFFSQIAQVKEEIVESQKEEKNKFLKKYKIESIVPEELFGRLLQAKEDLEQELKEEIEKVEAQPIVETVVEEPTTVIAEVSEEQPKQKTIVDQVVAKITQQQENTNLFTDPQPEKTSPTIKALQDKLKSLEQWMGKISMAGPGSGSYWLNDLGDTDKTSLKNATEGQVLTFNESTKKWYAADATGGGGGPTLDTYARVTANAAFNQANTSLSTGFYANTAWDVANSAYGKANSANVIAQSSYDFANTVNTYSYSAYAQANAAVNQASNAILRAIDANTLATTANTKAQAAFNQANTALSTGFYANLAWSHANAAFDYANTISGGSGVDTWARDKANTASVTAQSGFDKANSANVLAQAAFDQANTVSVTAQSGFDKANTTANIYFNTSNDLLPTATNTTKKRYFYSRTGTGAWSTLRAYEGSNIASGNATHIDLRYDVTTDAGIELDALFQAVSLDSSSPESVLHVEFYVSDFSNHNLKHYIAKRTFTMTDLNNLWGYSGVTGDIGLATFEVGDSFGVPYTQYVIEGVGITTSYNANNGKIAIQNEGQFAQSRGYVFSTSNTGSLTFPDGTIQTTAYTSTTPDQYARDTANTSNTKAQAAFDKANVANVLAQSGFDKANSANVLAQAAFDQANTAPTVIDTDIVAYANHVLKNKRTKWEYPKIRDYRGSNPSAFGNGQCYIKFNLYDEIHTILNHAYNNSLPIKLELHAKSNATLTPYTVITSFLQVNPDEITGANWSYNGSQSSYGDTYYELYAASVESFDNLPELGGYHIEWVFLTVDTLTVNAITTITSTTANNNGFRFDADAKTLTFPDDTIQTTAFTGTDLSGQLQIAFDTANSATSISTSAYAQANTATTTGQAAFNKANTSGVTAQASFDKANTSGVTAQASFDKGNTSFIHANSAYNLANTAITTSGGSITGSLNVSYTPASTIGTALTITAANTIGGIGYADVFKITNTSGGATNGSKTFRVNNIGTLELINSAYTATLMGVSDSGEMSFAGSSSTNNDPTTNFLSFNNKGLTIYDDGNPHIHARSSGASMWINTNNGAIILGNQGVVNGGSPASAILMGSSTTIKAYCSIYGSKSYAISGYGYLATSGAGTIGGSSGTVPYSLYCDNRIQASEIDATSDERAKNIQGKIPLEQAMKFVREVDGIHYTWNKDAVEHNDTGLKAGFGAQAVHKAGFDHMIGVIPNDKMKEKVDEDGWVHPEGMQLTMGYNQAIPYHHEVIKNLLDRIEKLESELAELKKK